LLVLPSHSKEVNPSKLVVARKTDDVLGRS
jgi:hypothetical protein